MTDPYSTFDTFSVGSETEPSPPEPSSMPPLIARLPKIAPAPPQRETRQRFDKPESIRPESHLNDSTWEQDETRTDNSSTIGSRAAITGDPTATIRIDTVSPGMFDDRLSTESAEDTLGKTALGESGPATIPFEPLLSKTPAPTASSIDEPWTAWMLDIESTIQPYARWIALAAVIAAMGLTVVLLRGSGSVQMIEPTDTSPRVSIDAASTQGLAGDYETEGAPPFWPTGVAEETIDAGPTNNLPTYASQDRGLRPLDSSVASATPPPVAAGPASAARASGGAQFTGQIMPGDSQRIDVADAKYNTANPGSLR